MHLPDAPDRTSIDARYEAIYTEFDTILPILQYGSVADIQYLPQCPELVIMRISRADIDLLNMQSAFTRARVWPGGCFVYQKPDGSRGSEPNNRLDLKLLH